MELNRKELLNQIQVHIDNGIIKPDELHEFIPVCKACLYKGIVGTVFLIGICIFVGTLI